MPVYRRRRYGRKPSKKVAKRVYRKRTYGKKISNSLTRQVKNIVHRMTENKTWTQSGLNQVISGPITGSTSLTSVNPWSLQLLPQLFQGTGNSGRIGNRVRLVKNNIRGFINLKPYVAVTAPYTAPCMVKMFVFSPKSFSNFTGDMGYTNWQQFFRINNADTGFSGTLLDLAYHVNTELYTLHTTRTFQLNNNGTGSGVYQSPSGQFTKAFNINLIKYAKDLKYDDNTSQRVTNKSLILVPICCLGDGSTNSYVTPLDTCEIQYIHECEYEDL